MMLDPTYSMDHHQELLSRLATVLRGARCTMQTAQEIPTSSFLVIGCHSPGMSLFSAREIVSFLVACRIWLVTCHYVCRLDLYNVMMFSNITPYIIDEQSTFPIVFAVCVL